MFVRYTVNRKIIYIQNIHFFKRKSKYRAISHLLCNFERGLKCNSQLKTDNVKESMTWVFLFYCSTKFISKFLIANGSGYALKLPFISRQGILSPLKFMMESSMNATSAVFLVSNVSNNMASTMSVMDDSGNLTSLAANINKSSNK